MADAPKGKRVTQTDRWCWVLSTTNYSRNDWQQTYAGSEGLHLKAGRDGERFERGAIPNSLALNLEDRLSILSKEKGSRGVLHSGTQKVSEQLRKHFTQSSFRVNSPQ